MSIWILKAIIQKTISFFPNKHHVNHWFQKNVTKGVFLSDEYFEDRLTHLQSHLEAYHKQGGIPETHTSLELGTGWYPVIPIGMYLAGFEKVYSVDISPLCTAENVITTLQKFMEYEVSGKLSRWIPKLNEERWNFLKQQFETGRGLPLKEILGRFHIELLVEDARKLSLPSDSVQLITSNNTFEHIYPDILKDILREFQRICAPNGVMSHFIDMSDHFAHFDKKITIYHFLQFSENTWKWIDNEVQPMNRLRINQYKEMYQQINLKIHEEHHRKGDLAALKSIKLASPFKEMSIDEVVISHSLLISVKK